MANVSAQKGVAFNTISNLTRQVSQIASLIVFARYFSPAEVGIYAILMVFFNFIQMTSTLGTAQAIIQKKYVSPTLLSSIFYVNVFLGCVFFAAAYFLSPVIAEFVQIPEVRTELQFLSPAFLLFSTSLVPKALLEREIDYKSIAIIEGFSSILSTVLAFVFIYLDFGIRVFSLMILINSVLSAALSFFCVNWRPRLKFSVSELSEIKSYALDVFYFGFINFFARQSDNFLIARYLGNAQLGLYSVSYKLVMAPLDNISRVIFRVMFPAISRIDDQRSSQEIYINALGASLLLVIPVCVGIFLLSDIFVDVVLGPDWQATTPVIKVLVLVTCIQAFSVTSGSIFLAKGASRTMLILGIINAVIVFALFWVSVSHGIVAMALAYLAANVLTGIPSCLLAWRILDLKLGDVGRAAAPAIICSALMGAALQMLREVVVDSNATLLTSLVLFGFLLYYFCLVFLFPSAIEPYKKLLERYVVKTHQSKTN